MRMQDQVKEVQVANFDEGVSRRILFEADRLLSEKCLQFLKPDGDKMLEIKLAATGMSYYPQLDVFMPRIEYLEKCQGNMSGEEWASILERMAENSVSFFKENLLGNVDSIGEWVFSGLRSEQPIRNLFSGTELIKNFYEKCNFEQNLSWHSSEENSNDKAQQIIRATFERFYGFPFGKGMPIICRQDFRLKQKDCKSSQSLLTLVQIEVELADEDKQNLIAQLRTVRKLCSRFEHSSEKLSPDLSDVIADILLSTDRMRNNQPLFSPKVLEDPNQGHWDLWKRNVKIAEKKGKKHHRSRKGYGISVKLPNKMFARNPVADIVTNGFVGIDFGTKSTVVVRWDSDEEALRIGVDDYTKAPQPQHYENPTMLEFLDINSFLRDYRASDGRPFTRWADIKSSHEAQSDLNGVSKKNARANLAFFAGLKQWAGYGDRRIVVCGRTSNECLTLPAYVEIPSGELDPIEIYAYYIGLAVNNMAEKKVVLRYILSFPATFNTKVRERICDSFRRGIRKSIPATVLDDCECQKMFSVAAGVSEPAAYAVCALKCLNLDLTRPIPYAVFDFGGGTTDFDFGIWRFTTEEEFNKWNADYVIDHFGSGGETYLGGENLLEELAYVVYTDNRDKVAPEGGEKFFPLASPHQCDKKVGFEALIGDSQEGRVNLYKLSEKLRAVWENPDSSGNMSEVKCDMFSSDGEVESLDLEVNVKKLYEIIRRRITDGVKNFLEALVSAFGRLNGDLIKEIHGQQIHILLAGNSSKSSFVKEIFEREMADFAGKVCRGKLGTGMDVFKLHPPLGYMWPSERRSGDVPADNAAMSEDKSEAGSRGPVEDAAFCRKLNEEYESARKANSFSQGEPSPLLSKGVNGKTGVAFGLVLSAPGRGIKVIDENRSEKGGGEVHFRFFVGLVRRDVFKPTLRPETPYGKWHSLCTSDVEGGFVQLYFTSSNEAGTGEMRVSSRLMRETIQFDRVPEKRVLIRCKGPSTIEWRVSRVDKNGNPIGKTEQLGVVELKEGR